MKRALDIVVSLLVLFLFLPFGLIIVIVLRCTGERYVFYVQQRVGKHEQTFGLIKFASMLRDSPNMATGTVTVERDPRVLPFGRFLRKTKLNEIPQLLNVLKGDISLVGPRPLTPQTFAYYDREVQEQIAQMTPGLTGVGSIILRDEEGIVARLGMEALKCHKEYIAPYKGQLEMWYREHRSLLLDVKLFFLTALVVLAPGNRLAAKTFKDLPPAPFKDLL